MFDEEFLEKLPNDPYKSALSMVEMFLAKVGRIPPFDTEKLKHYDEFIEAYVAFEAFANAFRIANPKPALGHARIENIANIINFFNGMQKNLDAKVMDLNLSRARDKFKIKFGSVFAYQFSDGDLNRIQILLNELRDLIIESELYDAKHKERILNKLEGLQKALHKKMSSLAKFWDLMGEAGVALGKFGKDAKPFVDRIKEILQITWRTQVRAEELPSATPLPLLSHGHTEIKEPE